MKEKPFKTFYELSSDKLHHCLDVAMQELSGKEKLSLAKHLLKVCNSSRGLKCAPSPYNAHKDLIKRYIKETFKLEDKFMKENDTSSLWATPAIRFLVEKAENLPPMDADGSGDPFFKIFLPDSKVKPFVSNYIENNLFPIWNDVVLLEVEPSLIKANHEVICEVWDKDPTNIYEIVKDFKGVRRFRDAWYAVKDLSEWLVHLFFNINIDDKIGKISIFLNDIPATDLRLCKILKDSNGQSSGRIKLIVGWGSYISATADKKMKALISHFQLIKHCLLWHCQELVNDLEAADNIDSLDFQKFFYIPALTLINQHRIQNNMSHFENDVSFACVTIEILCLELEKEASNFRAVLASLLTNHAIIFANLNWHSNEYISSLNQFYLKTFTKLFDTYLSKFDTLLNNVITGQRQSCVYQEFLQILRLFSKQDKTFPDSLFRQKVNNKLANFIINYMKDNFDQITSWSKLTVELEDFEERLSKYWSQGTYMILGSEGRVKVKTLFDSKIKSKVLNIISQYKMKPEASEKDLRNAYQFVQKLDSIIGGYVVKESKETEIIDTLQPTDIPQPFSPVAMKPEPKKKFGKFLGEMIFSKSNVNIWKSLTSDKSMMISLPPSSVGKLQEEALKLKRDTKNELKIEDLRLSPNFGFSPKIEGMNFSEVFTRDVLQIWLKAILDRCKQSVSTAITEELEIISSPNEIDSSPVIQRFFYDVIGNTIYFFTNLNFWDTQFFDETLNHLLSVVKSFSATLTSRGLTEAGHLKVNPQTFLIRIVNDLAILKEKFLRKDLIEILTEYQAQDVWQSVYDYLTCEKIEFKSRYYSNPTLSSERKQALEKLSLIELSKQAVTICLLIDETCDELSKLEDKLVDQIGCYITSLCLNDLRQFVESSPKINAKAYLEAIVEKFDNNRIDYLKQIYASQSKTNFFFFVKHNLTLNVDLFFNYLNQAFIKENGAKKLQRRLTRIQIYRLSIISEKLMEHLLNHFKTLTLPGYVHPSIGKELYEYEFKIDISTIKTVE